MRMADHAKGQKPSASGDASRAAQIRRESVMGPEERAAVAQRMADLERALRPAARGR